MRREKVNFIISKVKYFANNKLLTRDAAPTQDELKSELRVNEMKQLLTNKECPHVKDFKTNRNSKPSTLFSIAYDDNGEQKTLDFVAPDDLTFNYWIDGIACLLEQNMLSKQMEEDFETLLSVEIKLRLLDTEGVDISKEAPEIPPEPEVRKSFSSPNANSS